MVWNNMMLKKKSKFMEKGFNINKNMLKAV